MSIHTSIDSAYLHSVYRYGNKPEPSEISFKASVTDLRLIDLRTDIGLILSPNLYCAALYECHQLVDTKSPVYPQQIVVWYVYVLDPQLVKASRALTACRRCEPQPVYQVEFSLSSILRDGMLHFGCPIPLHVGIASSVMQLGPAD